MTRLLLMMADWGYPLDSIQLGLLVKWVFRLMWQNPALIQVLSGCKQNRIIFGIIILLKVISPIHFNKVKELFQP